MWKMSASSGASRRAKNAINTIDKLYARLTVGDQQLLYYEAVNMLTAGRIIAQSALWRRESRGAHFRRDYPRSDDLFWVKHLSFRTW